MTIACLKIKFYFIYFYKLIFNQSYDLYDKENELYKINYK
jgi:hypothetical protein